jgi:hypothetical protein
MLVFVVGSYLIIVNGFVSAKVSLLVFPVEVIAPII